jgi:carbon storage regulator
MLVLSRKAGEYIKIGENIIVRIAEVRGENVRVAIEAPKNIKIYRGELYEAISEANREATVLPGLLELPPK